MSKWISDNTNGTLSPEISFDSETLMNIVNTVYFYDEWSERFEKSENTKGDFFANGKTVKAEYMCTTDSKAVYFGDNFVRADRSFKNGGRMEFVLPNEGVNIEELISDPASLKEALTGGTEKGGVITHWQLPKFSFGSSYENISEVLKKLGINKAFSETEADFSAMYGGKEKLYINRVIQETHIAVDEKGYVICGDRPYGMTTRRGVFAGGDVVHRPQTVVLAMKAAKEVAIGIAQYVDAIKLLEYCDANSTK